MVYTFCSVMLPGSSLMQWLSWGKYLIIQWLIMLIPLPGLEQLQLNFRQMQVVNGVDCLELSLTKNINLASHFGTIGNMIVRLYVFTVLLRWKYWYWITYNLRNLFVTIKRYDRNEMFDFIPIVVDGLCLTMYPQPPEYDIGLFIRPYRRER